MSIILAVMKLTTWQDTRNVFLMVCTEQVVMKSPKFILQRDLPECQQHLDELIRENVSHIHVEMKTTVKYIQYIYMQIYEKAIEIQ